jgi:hypothetical protein
MEKHAIYKLIESDESGVLREGARSYSGRCMYGRSCLGIDGDMSVIMANLLSTAMELAANGQLHSFDRAEISDAIGNMRTDSMGRGIIVYFPDIAFDASNESYGDDEEGDSMFGEGHGDPA